MVVRWNHVATLVVVTLTVIHCEGSNARQVQFDKSNSKAEDMCPCLPVNICPRAFGTNPEDAKYLGDIKKCDDNNKVRCCGASASFIVGTPAPKVELGTTQVPQPDIMSRLNPDDHENEIPYADNESGALASTISPDDDTTDASGYGVAENVKNFRQHTNEEDEEPAESKSIPKTTKLVAQSSDEIKIEESSTVVVTAEKPIKSHRKPKTLEDVMTVYPNFMSGIPKTTPKNMPETNEMKMFDTETGMDLHLVFSRTTLKPDVSTQTIEEKDDMVPSAKVHSTSKPYRFAKRRRQYRPIQGLTTESPVDEMEIIPTTLNSRTMTGPSNKVKTQNLKPSPQESTTRPSRAKPTRVPLVHEEEILHTSEDDQTHQNRFRLYSARHRLNYLRRTTTTTATTETPIEMTTRHTSQPKTLGNRRPTKMNKNISDSNVLVNGRPSKMNDTLILLMDINHRNMISKVRVALKAASTENRIVEIPRSFANADMDNRVKKIEKMVVDKMMNAYAEVKSKRRGERPKTKESNNVVRSNPQITPTERPIVNVISNSTRPYRGRKKFEMSDLLDKTAIVPITPNEGRRMRIRSTTVKPVEVVTDEAIKPTTRRPRRRPTTTIQPITFGQKFDENKTLIQDSSAPTPKPERQYRRRMNIRRKFTDEPILTTTVTPPVRTTAGLSTIHTNFPKTATSTIATTVPTTIPPETAKPTTTTTEASIVRNESQEESHDIDKSTEPVEIEEIVTVLSPTPNVDSDISSEFKPSPLWSIKSDGQTAFIDIEPNSSYDVDEIANRKSNRQSRDAFAPPNKYLKGFIPVTPLKSPF